VQFCPKCGKVILKYVRKDGKVIGICSNNHEIPVDTSQIRVKYPSKKKHVAVVVDTTEECKNEEIDSIPCPHCGSRRTKILYTFVMYADEDQVVIVKCLDCGKNFRSGTWVSGGS
jgi:DNA-directed RNA polymerase subunit M/transcription elongation factor TFIIS